MTIDPSQVQWDQTPRSSDKPIDASKVIWDTPSLTDSQQLVADATKNGPFGQSVEDTAHAIASGTYHNIVGGYAGIGKLITGQGLDAAADAVRNETDKAYQAPDSTLKSVLESPFNPINYAQEGADYAADFAEKHGASPLLSTGINALPAALPAALGTGRLLRGLPGKIKEFAGYGPTPDPIPPKPTPEEVVSRAVARQSTGAAATAPDLSIVSPELRDAVAAAKNPNLDAIKAHVDAETLPLPEGEKPLRLRKGQATDDPQQRSDEKNFRTDPDTQGILVDSINDQDRKLALSMGEIQRRANPDIVGLTNTDYDQMAIDAIKAHDNETVKDIRTKYKALADANSGMIPIDTGYVVNDVADKFDHEGLRYTVLENPVLREMMEDLRSGKPIRFDKFEAMRTNLADLQRGPPSATGKAASILHNALNEMPLAPGAAPLRALADQARSAARARFDTIKRNPAYKAAINDNVDKTEDGFHDLTAPSPLAGTFLNNYAIGGGKNASRAFVNRLKQAVPNQQLSDAIEAAALNKVRQTAKIDPTGQGQFANKSFADAVTALEPKASTLLKPETFENLQHLKRVSGRVNNESKADSTNYSNSTTTLARFGAITPKVPSIAGNLANIGTDVVAHKAGPLGIFGKNIATKYFDKKTDEKLKQSIKDAKLKFAQDAVSPGAGIESPDSPPVQRASGGRATTTDEQLVDRLMRRYKAAKAASDRATKPLLRVPDETIIHALKITGSRL